MRTEHGLGPPGCALIARSLGAGVLLAISPREGDVRGGQLGIDGERRVQSLFGPCREGLRTPFELGGAVFEQSLKALARGGRAVLCGATAEAGATLNLRAVFFKSLSVLGSTMGSLAELKEVLSFFETGQLKPVIDRILPLDRAPEAQQLLTRRALFGKIVLTVGNAEVACRPPAAATVRETTESEGLA